MITYFTKGDLAKRSGLTQSGIVSAEQRGELRPNAKTEGGILLYKRAQVEEFVKSRELFRRINKL